eukprot:TRINITY_DN58628_c0_g1_i1.p1 TRINITY_DN58628_c0_g1~~TRINITY_DN58628_c0_g1_i1.p1  ORF type:complete len:272 (+),score=28.52 TRINITY_DN58628_c0_g1_i1:150-965(+)
MIAGTRKRPASELSSRKELEFFSAWFCPYAQRAWIALEHHGLPYKKIEGLIPDKPGEDFVGYVKNPRLLELNPKGLVPTISEGNDSPPVYESLICVEYIDELASGLSTDVSLLPGAPSARADLKLKADWVNRCCCSPFYQILVRKDNAEREAALKDLNAGVDELEKLVSKSGGPFLAGKQLTIVDLAFIPWAHRIMICKILERFRGPTFALDMTRRPALASWLDKVFSLPAVQATLAEPDALATTYKRYADGVAQSKVAEAVRQGKAAHTV